LKKDAIKNFTKKSGTVTSSTLLFYQARFTFIKRLN